MQWKAVRKALAHLYGPLDGPHRRNMEQFARLTGLNPRTVRRILTTDQDSDAPIEWETLRAWLHATSGGSVITFLAPYEGSRASDVRVRGIAHIDLDLPAFTVAQYRELEALFRQRAQQIEEAELARTILARPKPNVVKHRR